ncbi:MAG: GFA family protein [Paracoccaceae bacterium]
MARVAFQKLQSNEETMTINGSCCCGAVRFVIKSAPNTMGTCHCSRCRKLGVSTIVFVKRDQFHLEAGADVIETMEPTAPYKYYRSFCRQCGTSLGEPMSPDESFPINAHCLDDDPGIRNAFHEHVAEAPAWIELPSATAVDQAQ